MAAGKKPFPQPPKLPPALEPLTLAPGGLEDEQSYGGFEMSDCALADQAAEKVQIDGAVFRNVAFERVSLRSVELTDVVFDNCDLSNADFGEAIMHRTVFRRCKIVGLELGGTTLRNVSFEDCAGDYATFRFASLKQVVFEHSSLAKADFYHSELSKVELRDADIDGAQLSGTKLSGIDLSGCRFYNLGVTLEDLQGCIISSPQAILFTKIFGLVVKDT